MLSKFFLVIPIPTCVLYGAKKIPMYFDVHCSVDNMKQCCCTCSSGDAGGFFKLELSLKTFPVKLTHQVVGDNWDY